MTRAGGRGAARRDISHERGPYRLGVSRRLVNAVVRLGVWTGLAPERFQLLLVPGRLSGRARSTPIIVHVQAGHRWLVAPYGERAWVKNARAAGRVILRRGWRTETVTVEEVGALEAAPVLKQYLSETPITGPFFAATPDAPLADFVREAPEHPVFRLTPRP